MNIRVLLRGLPRASVVLGWKVMGNAQFCRVIQR